jgi:thiosulfate/3-mercaptopyruvate sulfurtransferase
VLVSPTELRKLISDGSDAHSAPALLDVRWQLGGPPGREEYERGHIPGAVYVDLDSDLAAPPGPGGRHPLPDAAAFEAAMRRAGVSTARPAVVYDAANALAAARAWWLLRYFGHPDVRVLDGGLAAWVDHAGPTTTEPATPPPGDFVAAPGHLPVIDADGAAAAPQTGVLLDVRSAERFRGENEPIDPVAGHIPGATNLPDAELLDTTGRFRSPRELRATFESRGVTEGVEVAAYCGSGVTAAHAVLAMQIAGLTGALYPGSWSDWIGDPRRPIATGMI